MVLVVLFAFSSLSSPTGVTTTILHCYKLYIVADLADSDVDNDDNDKNNDDINDTTANNDDDDSQLARVL